MPDVSEAPSGIVIATRALSKSFGDVKAVRGVDIRVRRGEIYAFLGRNGAGKTTTIRMILGLVRPSSGEVELFGRPARGQGPARLGRIGSFVEGASAYPNLTVRENLDLQARATGAGRAAVSEAIGLLGLASCADRKAGRLSLGNKQRLSLARALVHGPELLVLDEPANGLDPAGILEIRELLRRLASQSGTTVFMSSHILAEVEQLADRVGIISDGELVEELDAAEIAARARLRVELECDAPERAEAVLREGLGYRELESEGGLVRVFDEAARVPDMARALVAAGVGIERLAQAREDLEVHFMRVTGGER